MVALLLTALIAVGGWGLHLYEQLNRADLACRETAATQSEKMAAFDARQQEVFRRLANVETEARLLTVEVAALRVMTTKAK